MGESKRRAERMTPHERAMQELTRRLVDEGKLIEAGWASLRAVWLHPETPSQQVTDLRMAFMAGAQHTWASVMGMLEEGEDATTADLTRMDKIQAELDAFGAELARDHYPTKGTA